MDTLEQYLKEKLRSPEFKVKRDEVLAAMWEAVSEAMDEEAFAFMEEAINHDLPHTEESLSDEASSESTKSLYREDMSTAESIEYFMREGCTDADIIESILDPAASSEDIIADLLVLIRKLLGIVQPYLANTYEDARKTSCVSCGRLGEIRVSFEYNESGKMTKADITGMENGWKMLPYGDVGGEAPYCPACLKNVCND